MMWRVFVAAQPVTLFFLLWSVCFDFTYKTTSQSVLKPWGTDSFLFTGLSVNNWNKDVKWIWTHTHTHIVSVCRGNSFNTQNHVCSLQTKGDSDSHWAAAGSGSDHHTAGVGFNLERPLCGKPASPSLKVSVRFPVGGWTSELHVVHVQSDLICEALIHQKKKLPPDA